MRLLFLCVLPGGFLCVNTGLIRKAGSEAELAGVLAHLMIYVRTRALVRSRGPVGNYASQRPSALLQVTY